MVTRIVGESYYSPAAALFMVLKGQVLKILSRNQILTSIKSHNSVTDKQIMEGCNPNLDLVNINAFTIFGKIMSSPGLN